MQPDLDNAQFTLAVQFVNNTSQHIFLTGKAGTGKTTFLRYIKNNTHKKLAITAPTGIAAINAGGVTLHSFFQLPFGHFIPSNENVSMPNGNYFNKNTLVKQLRLPANKRRTIQELDLLIIDEVSMVRSDLLDAIDIILKHTRKVYHLPFGGVQMLFIGDLLQLPPVINDDSWRVLKNYYESPFFFDAQALKTNPPHYLELKKIYRQNDETFIRILNNLRNNKLLPEDFSILNKAYNKEFIPESIGEYITLTTHNSKAEEINQKELTKLIGTLFTYKAEISGDFNEKSIIAESTLNLKIGAQIMFIKNDKGDIKKFYNGKLGTIKDLKHDKICVEFPGSDEDVVVEQETWKNIRYTYNKDSDAIQEEELGTFIQYPLRLAWAITIHKSQGLTFKKAIIDAGDSFAPGQVYVALSRLTSLDGLVLHSKIQSSSINTDQQALAYSSTEKDNEALSADLKAAQKNYLLGLLLEVFQLNTLKEIFEDFKNNMLDRKLTFLDEATNLAIDLLSKLTLLSTTAEKFNKQLIKILDTAEHDNFSTMKERVEAAVKYFSNELSLNVLTPLDKHYEKVKSRKKVKQYASDLKELLEIIKRKDNQFSQAMLLAAGLASGAEPAVLLQELREARKNAEVVILKKTQKIAKEKKEKGGSQKLSLQLYKDGKSVIQIAAERGYTVSTIESHLASFIETGEILIHELVSEFKIAAITNLTIELGEVPSGIYKEKLGEEFSYAEIKAVRNFLKLNNNPISI